ncbi:hypothetical protein DFQ14_10893 [Halopolyspora algeriensis]|uniref:Uncharacterized protein n=1 Tax=Halopolyspora algeriensis TaxID=1500506 RepID=A0A368VQU7_9ACTN|nr:hypothetical protein DFQ14_10893 [Halopolyspora algeriensis]TQM56693.1 hypothetical protein FHU43_1507 [Halopolyspora algeriensis]
MALILLVLGLVGVGAVSVAWWPLPAVLGGSPAEWRPATATVIESASCAASTKGDLVEVTVDGHRVQARYDGCGHRRGERLAVRVPADVSGEFVVRPAARVGSETAGESGLRQRLNRVLLTLAGIAGGGYILMMRWTTRRESGHSPPRDHTHVR